MAQRARRPTRLPAENAAMPDRVGALPDSPLWTLAVVSGRRGTRLFAADAGLGEAWVDAPARDRRGEVCAAAALRSAEALRSTGAERAPEALRSAGAERPDEAGRADEAGGAV